MTAEETAPKNRLEELRRMLHDDVGLWAARAPSCILVSDVGTVASAGDVDRVLPWASVTKVVSALAVLEVVTAGRLGLDDPAGPPGSTLRHLLAHASGLAFDEERVLARPGRRRIYSNVGIDLAVSIAVQRSGRRDAATLLHETVLAPLGMHRTALVGRPSFGAQGPAADLALLAHELLAPAALSPGVVDAAITPTFPELAGVLPGFGRQEPNNWGLGIELRGSKSPHWLPKAASPSSGGHFGLAGAFVWVDRVHGLAAACATGTQFGPWAAATWPHDLGRWLDAWLLVSASDDCMNI